MFSYLDFFVELCCHVASNLVSNYFQKCDFSRFKLCILRNELNLWNSLTTRNCHVLNKSHFLFPPSRNSCFHFTHIKISLSVLPCLHFIKSNPHRQVNSITSNLMDHNHRTMQGKVCWSGFRFLMNLCVNNEHRAKYRHGWTWM